MASYAAPSVKFPVYECLLPDFTGHVATSKGRSNAETKLLLAARLQLFLNLFYHLPHCCKPLSYHESLTYSSMQDPLLALVVRHLALFCQDFFSDGPGFPGPQSSQPPPRTFWGVLFAWSLKCSLCRLPHQGSRSRHACLSACTLCSWAVYSHIYGLLCQLLVYTNHPLMLS